jgi:methylenetetrahydrofolate reductase (NADPH)
VAAHPAGHPRSPDLATDRRHLADKLAMADFAVTQFFFEVAEYERLRDDLAALGVDKPVLPGILPIASLTTLRRTGPMGAAAPAWVVERLEAAAPAGPEAVRAEGVAIATGLCSDLLAAGAPGLHFFTLNRSTATREIYAALGLRGGAPPAERPG